MRSLKLNSAGCLTSREGGLDESPKSNAKGKVMNPKLSEREAVAQELRRVVEQGYENALNMPDKINAIVGDIIKREWGSEERMKEAARNGDLDACVIMGIREYALRGTSELVDHANKALNTWQVPSQRGHPGAKFYTGVELARIKQFDESSPILYSAQEYWLEAAKLGHPEAQFCLGAMCIMGDGEDYVRAYMWFDIAVACKHETAERARCLLDELMTSQEIAKAREQALEWLHAHPNASDQDGFMDLRI